MKTVEDLKKVPVGRVAGLPFPDYETAVAIQKRLGVITESAGWPEITPNRRAYISTVVGEIVYVARLK